MLVLVILLLAGPMHVVVGVGRAVRVSVLVLVVDVIVLVVCVLVRMDGAVRVCVLVGVWFLVRVVAHAAPFAHSDWARA